MSKESFVVPKTGELLVLDITENKVPNGWNVFRSGKYAWFVYEEGSEVPEGAFIIDGV